MRLEVNFHGPIIFSSETTFGLTLVFLVCMYDISYTYVYMFFGSFGTLAKLSCFMTCEMHS